ncbi:hypothetical protein Q8W71_00785 [Methylobacterium sp. NEAU 140]|uniref:hypothetical protein n=1 Tax=Methylobacterium sp. NEAU 140 TaxID=3064945 RepID=UPI002733D59D|nr:hypothetical protein [Methylobacterium sp. NEAU 140]MDP4021145.1 hypothetical protein [Methylobacterium sp. NEAU 140]
MSGSAVEDRTDLLGKLVDPERLRQQVRPGIEDPVVDDRITRVACAMASTAVVAVMI